MRPRLRLQRITATLLSLRRFPACPQHRQYDRAIETGAADRGNDRGACQVEQAFERINSKEVRNGQLFFARQQQGPHRLTGAAKKENSSEACERHRVNRAEARRAQIPLENFPAERTQRVAGVDGNNRKNQKEGLALRMAWSSFAPLKSVRWIIPLER